MEKRLVDFVAALRAMGVRVSISESQDAFESMRHLGIQDRDSFRLSLRATLVKDSGDLPVFEELFPLYFSSGGPPLLNTLDDLSPEERQMLAAALRALLEKMRQNRDQDGDQQQNQQGHMSPMSDSQLASLLGLLQMLLAGQNPSNDQMQDMGDQVGLNNASHRYQQSWMERRMQRQMGMDKLDEVLGQLWEMLSDMGMSDEALAELQDMVQANRDALSEQVNQFVGSSIMQQAVDEKQKPNSDNLMDRPFHSLNEDDRDALRDETRRLAAQLRSRAALRQKRGKVGILDAKRTIRANMRYGGIPIELQFKTKQLKPKLVLICDVSTSMRPVAEFMLTMIYELQDQTAKTRSFAFIDNMTEISDAFAEYPAQVALNIVLERLQAGYYNTDLGYSLATFTRDYMDAVDHRTTVIFIGDGRNNYNDPRLDCVEAIKRRAKRIMWMTPEDVPMWGSGDSDMHLYAPYCDFIHHVTNMTQLTEAIDRLLTS
ncbi:MAG: VWA domain-containing protein [Chloroflexota bacterium]